MEDTGWAKRALQARLSDPNRTVGNYKQRVARSAQTNHGLKPLWDKLQVTEKFNAARAEKDPEKRQQAVGDYVQAHKDFNEIVHKGMRRNKSNPGMVGTSLGQHSMNVHLEREAKKKKKADAAKNKAKPKKKSS